MGMECSEAMIDLAESELWIHGTIEVEAQPEGEYCEAG